MNSIPQGSEIITTQQARELATAGLMYQAGQAANQAAAAGVFADYLGRKAANTEKRQRVDLACFAEYLTAAHVYTFPEKAKETPGERQARLMGFVRSRGEELGANPEAWRGITWGLVEAFKRWMLANGYAIGTVNFRLSTVKVYCKLAMKAGAIDPQEYALIRAVEGFAHKEIKNVDELREASGTATRKGAKKAEAVSITPAQAKQLKDQPDTPQGRRDAVLMAILLDHGLRCGEVALLRVENIDLERGLMIFQRPKVQRQQTHKLSQAALQVLRDYLENDHPLLTGPLLLASKKGGRKGAGGGKLGGAGMTERAITKRVEYLGELIGLPGLSAHDCRHYWATQAARNGTHIERLKDAGGWSSLAMPGRYIEAAKIANEGVNLGAD